MEFRGAFRRQVHVDLRNIRLSGKLLQRTSVTISSLPSELLTPLILAFTVKRDIAFKTRVNESRVRADSPHFSPHLVAALRLKCKFPLIR